MDLKVNCASQFELPNDLTFFPVLVFLEHSAGKPLVRALRLVAVSHAVVLYALHQITCPDAGGHTGTFPSHSVIARFSQLCHTLMAVKAGVDYVSGSTGCHTWTECSIHTASKVLWVIRVRWQ